MLVPLRYFTSAVLPITKPEVLFKESVLSVISPAVEIIPEVATEVDGLVFWLAIELDVMLRSLLARIRAVDELVKDALLIVKLLPDCKVPEFVTELLAFKVKSEVAEIAW